MSSHLPHPMLNQCPTQDQHSAPNKIRHDKIWELIEATPWRERAKASSTGSTLDLLRSESLRMDETTPTASSTLGRKESPSPPVSESVIFNPSALGEGGPTLFAGGFQTVRGMTANGCSTAQPEGPFAFAENPERGYELKTLGASAEGDSACSGFRTWVDGEEEDAPNFGTLTEAGRSLSTESRVFRFTLRGFRDNVSNRARSSPLVGLVAEGPMEETFMVEGGEGLKAAEQADLELKDPGISDLISST